MSSGTGVVRHDLYKQHLADFPHVESPQRLQAIYDMLDRGDMAGKFVTISPRPATRDELAWVHSRSHIKRVADTDGKVHVALDSDTQTTPLSYEAAKLAAGGLFSLVDKIFDGTLKNGFALVRPPGHHAERDRAMGFCLFNNVALAARYAMNTYGVKKILIVDWDLHHGNATQHTFDTDPAVLYFSTHQYPYYPGSGGLREVGHGDGMGFTVNVPLWPGHGDAAFFQIFKRILCPIASAFQPEFILVSAGFDTYAGDPLGGMEVTPQGYAALTRLIMDLAREHASERLAMTLEGGYHLRGLSESVMAVLKELVGDSILTASNIQALEKGATPPIVEEVIQVQRPYWPSL
ncbi:MAG: histone deacetylase [Deltaproteobacteria bacterium]|nr:histone deacetylase [Deltaproteobacteria bacterium]MBW2019399.1 histone deacetylase [Deltaproteobacteria bacterium]MBW2074236.1 histone deacetylase [Deltaproteobacteria bacterium]RLB83915.1 MAG: histone deacetylase [Deltaproteobacteria bacterium]